MSLEMLSVVVVDDNAPMRKILGAMLRACGIEQIYAARDGQEALDIIRRRGPDLAIVDLEMPGLGGLDLIHLIRRSEDSPNRFLPIIVLTGHSDARHVLEARDLGATEIMAKPISAKTLIDRLNRLIAHPREFVQAEGYFGPDRRRRRGAEHYGPYRRSDDQAAGGG
jgi:two-component system, chemotaxis family, chemotaxis protein CheY